MTYQRLSPGMGSSPGQTGSNLREQLKKYKEQSSLGGADPRAVKAQKAINAQERQIEHFDSPDSLDNSDFGNLNSDGSVGGSGATTPGGGEAASAGMSAAAGSALIGVGGAVISGVQKAEAARRQAVLEDIKRMRSESVTAMRDTQNMQDRALSAIDDVYRRFTA